ncbi:MAG TPA: hypothetical protein VFV38_40295 [Ktedonobacteraceae bacterium]|nr:hypothetical protein [Ktedonobacteraceae bacterium]
MRPAIWGPCKGAWLPRALCAVPILGIMCLYSLNAFSFSAALTEDPVAALRMLFLNDLLSQPPVPGKQTGGQLHQTSSGPLILMACTKRPANVSRLRLMTCLLRFADWMRSVSLATLDASLGRGCARGP